MHLNYIQKGVPASSLDLQLSFFSCISAETRSTRVLLSSHHPSTNSGFYRREPWPTLARALNWVTGDWRAPLDIWDTARAPRWTTFGAYLREHNEGSLSFSCPCCSHKSTAILRRFYQGCTWEASFMELNWIELNIPCFVSWITPLDTGTFAY